MNVQHAEAEWLEADGLGGFASGTVGGIRTRRYHGLLLVAVTPPTGRMMLVNGCDAWVDTPEGIRALSSQRYRPDVVHPDGAARLMAFSADPWPRWTYAVSGAVRIIQELFVVPGVRRVVSCSCRAGRTSPRRGAWCPSAASTASRPSCRSSPARSSGSPC